MREGGAEGPALHVVVRPPEHRRSCDYPAKRLLTRPGFRCPVEVQMPGLQAVVFVLAVYDSGLAGGT